MNISHLFRQVVYLQASTGTKGAHKDPLFPALPTGQVKAMARVEPSAKLVRRQGSDEEVTTSSLMMLGVQIDQFTRVWLPGADQTAISAARFPIRVDPVADLDGITDTWEVYF